MAAKKSVPAENLTFEEALKELEELSAKMSQGTLPLEESISCYARGVELTKQCRKLLDNAERKIQVLDGELADLSKSSLRQNSNERDPAEETETISVKRTETFKDDGIPF